MDSLKSAASGGMFGLLPMLLGGGSSVPKPKPPPVMPTPDDEAVRRAKMLEIQKAQMRSGRQSTILGGSSTETLGG